jgi:hypothetical protein
VPKIIYVGLDIDATVITHCYPHMNGDDIGAIPWLLSIQKDFPIEYLINSMRGGKTATDAKEWLEERGVKIGGINTHPTQHTWTTSTKTHCHVYLDDRGAATPLRPDMAIDWAKFGPLAYSCVKRWHEYYEAHGANATGPVKKKV